MLASFLAPLLGEGGGSAFRKGIVCEDFVHHGPCQGHTSHAVDFCFLKFICHHVHFILGMQLHNLKNKTMELEGSSNSTRHLQITYPFIVFGVQIVLSFRDAIQ